MELIEKIESILRQVDRHQTVDVQALAQVLAEITGRKREATTCSTCINQQLKELRGHYMKLLAAQSSIETTPEQPDGTGPDSQEATDPADGAGNRKRNRKRQA